MRMGYTKEDVLTRLCLALKCTMAGEDILTLHLVDKDTVEIVFKHGNSKMVNIAMDSGITMIRDICKEI